MVSIVINNYNYARYLGEAIDSSLGQDYSEIEILVVDDGSIDDSREVIRRYADRVIPVLQANGGQGAAYNAGFAACRGDIVLFLDADDRLYPSAVSEIVRHWRPDLSKVQFSLNLIDGNGRSLGRPLLKVRPDEKTIRPLLRKYLFYPSPPGSGNAYGRNFLAKILPLPPETWRIAADSYLIFAAPLAGEVVHLDACLGDYRRHNDGASAHAPDKRTAFVKKEHQKMMTARDYVAGLLQSSNQSAVGGCYAFPPAYLKLEVAEAFLCHPGQVLLSDRFRLIKESFRTALGWTPWSWSKRLALPVWVALVCVLPQKIRNKILSVSLMHSGY